MMLRPSRRVRLGLLFAAVLLLPGTAPAEHHEKAAEGAAMIAEKIDLKGKVISIDKAARTVVVQGERGAQVEIVAPANAPNFDQIKVGDPVAATYVESVALAIAPVAGAAPGVTETVAVSAAPPGGTPGAAIAEQIELRAVVKAVDLKARSVTLDVPGGGERTLKVDPGIALEKVKTGEQVTVTLTRAFAISIDKR